MRKLIAHHSGVGGVTWRQRSGPTQSRVTLAPDQAIALEQAAQQHGDQPTLWGLDGADAVGRRLDPLRFIDRFVPVMITLLDELVDALANDLNAAELDPPSEQFAQISTLALFGGLTEHVRITPATSRAE